MIDLGGAGVRDGGYFGEDCLVLGGPIGAAWGVGVARPDWTWHAERGSDGLHREASQGGDDQRRACFRASGLQGLAQDLGFHGLAAKQAFQFADPVFKFADAAHGNDLLSALRAS